MNAVRRMLLLFATLGTALGISVATAGSASATYGPLAQYQVTLSANCNNSNPSICPNGTGGMWGWAVFNSNGTGDLQATDCFHLLGFGGGAGHSDVDIFAWHIEGGVFVIDSASDPNFVGPSPIPSTPGHYSDHPAPGVAVEIQVTKIPNR